MQPSQDVGRLIEIMRALRDPNDGCPWDIEQTFDTIVPYTIEETYEVVDAIERRDPEDLREELGDLLLQVVYHAQLASELGLFEFGDVVETITRKMIRRHPHVFGDAEARSARSAKGQWNKIKAEEKAERAEARRERQEAASQRPGPENGHEAWFELGAPSGGMEGQLASVPGSFPALMLAQKVQEAAAKVGFDWTVPAPIFDKIEEETEELRVAVASEQRDAQEDELGDLLFSVVNLSRRLEIDPDAALRRTVRKFRTRFSHMEQQAASETQSLADLSLEELESLWVAAKGATTHAR